MFTNPAAEEFHTGVVREKTLPEAVLDVMIYCYYSGFTSTEEELAVSIFKLADKYSMTGMKNKLEKRFIEELSNEVVLEMVELADTHSAEDLKEVSGGLLNR